MASLARPRTDERTIESQTSVETTQGTDHPDKDTTRGSHRISSNSSERLPAGSIELATETRAASDIAPEDDAVAADSVRRGGSGSNGGGGEDDDEGTASAVTSVRCQAPAAAAARAGLGGAESLEPVAPRALAATSASGEGASSLS